MCAFNYAKKHVIPEEFTFKSEKYESIPIVMDYFSEEKLAGMIELNDQQVVT